MENASIVIKAADKGGATVIINRTDYHSEVTRQLNDTAVYAKLSEDPLPRLSGIVGGLINKALADGIIDQKTSLYLNNDSPPPLNFTFCRKYTRVWWPPLADQLWQAPTQSSKT